MTERPYDHDESCATCRFYFARCLGDQGNGELPTGQCRRNPPTAAFTIWRYFIPFFGKMYPWSVWGEARPTHDHPRTADYEWCGEYQRGENNMTPWEERYKHCPTCAAKQDKPEMKLEMNRK